jgi:prevent-host-death family protein
MSAPWPLQKAKNEFSRVVDRALSEGPQTVTRHGKPVVVVCAIGAVRGRTGNRKASTRALLALLRSCPVDLSRIVVRDRSVHRTVDLG